MELEPAAIAAFLRPLFWIAILAAIAVVLRFVPNKVRKILTYRLW